MNLHRLGDEIGETYKWFGSELTNDGDYTSRVNMMLCSHVYRLWFAELSLK